MFSSPYVILILLQEDHLRKKSLMVLSFLFTSSSRSLWHLKRQLLRWTNFKGCQPEVTRLKLLTASNTEREVQKMKAYCLNFEKDIGGLKHSVLMWSCIKSHRATLKRAKAQQYFFFFSLTKQFSSTSTLYWSMLQEFISCHWHFPLEIVINGWLQLQQWNSLFKCIF